jgi:hypothetical protein
MYTAQDYDSLAFVNFRGRVMEAYEGKDIVLWHGKIEGQLNNMLTDAEKSRNYPYADKLREFLRIWRSNEISGSINRETIETLKSASDILAVDTWDLSSYFRSLRDQLRVLIASEEELPRGSDMGQNDPYAGTSHGGGGPPMSPSFGPDNGSSAGGMGGSSGPGGMPGSNGPEMDLNGPPGADNGPGNPSEPGSEGQPGEPGSAEEEPNKPEDKDRYTKI